MAESNLFWDQLFQLIEEGKIVPVVGKDLLIVDDGTPGEMLYPLLAKRLAAYLGVEIDDFPEGGELNAVACHHLAAGNDVEDIYPALKAVMAREEIAIPDTLLELARIPFKLFVTTTFDPLLERAINEVRFGGQARTRVMAYSPNDREDLPEDFDQFDRPAVFHLFGRVSATPSYAVTQEDTLEFLHSLQSESRRPKLLFDKLNRGNLLLLGGSFGGWLARFFFRTAKGERLLRARGKTDYVADAQVRNDPSLLVFMRHFSRGTKIFESGGAVELVEELARRFRERNPSTDAGTVELPASSRAPVATVGPGAVFLSYASEDRDAVKLIKDALEAAGVDVFFDKDDLESGDDFEAKLRRSISDCSLFVPVISQQTLTGRRRFFRIEWTEAEEEARKVAASERFILPVVIDETSPDEARIPEKFTKLHWEKLPGGQPSREFVDTVVQLFRQYHKGAA